MKIFGAKFVSWDSVNYFFSKEENFSIGDRVVVDHVEVNDIAEIVEIEK